MVTVYHRQISFTKSLFRIAGYILLLFAFKTAIFLLVLSEVFGIIEEL